MLIKNKKNDLNIFVWPLSLEKDPWRKVDAALRFGKVKSIHCTIPITYTRTNKKITTCDSFCGGDHIS